MVVLRRGVDCGDWMIVIIVVAQNGGRLRRRFVDNFHSRRGDCDCCCRCVVVGVGVVVWVVDCANIVGCCSNRLGPHFFWNKGNFGRLRSSHGPHQLRHVIQPRNTQEKGQLEFAVVVIVMIASSLSAGGGWLDNHLRHKGGLDILRVARKGIGNILHAGSVHCILHALHARESRAVIPSQVHHFGEQLRPKVQNAIPLLGQFES
mmetsp:Transcript_20040/g.43120  ORF Transcript_20040/g.43120 Transcript_20040/m.43120 type:complete len:205 (+) Transcript_20040:197-811(+)